MVTPTAGAVVLVPFPFSDLSQAKLRPDARAILLTDASFAVGTLRVTSYARPGKLFTAHHTLMVSHVGTLQAEPLRQIIEAVVVILHTSLRP